MTIPPIAVPNPLQPLTDVAQLQQRVAVLEARLAALERILSPAPGGGVQLVAPGALRIAVGGACSIAVGTNLAVQAGGALQQNVGASYDLAVGGPIGIATGRELTIDGGDAAVVRTGSAQLQLKKNGDVAIGGNRIDIRGTGEVSVKASANLVLRGMKIVQN